MAYWTITLPPAAKTRVVNALAILHPIPLVDSESGGPPQPKYTKRQWAQMKIKEWMRSRVALAEESIKIQEAKLEVDTSDLNLQVEEE
jgi:hypothetical protein